MFIVYLATETLTCTRAREFSLTYAAVATHIALRFLNFGSGHLYDILSLFKDTLKQESKTEEESLYFGNGQTDRQENINNFALVINVIVS